MRLCRRSARIQVSYHTLSGKGAPMKKLLPLLLALALLLSGCGRREDAPPDPVQDPPSGTKEPGEPFRSSCGPPWRKINPLLRTPYRLPSGPLPPPRYRH